MCEIRRLRALRDQLDETISSERAAVTDLRRQLDNHRPTMGASMSCGRSADKFDAAAVRASLRAHQDKLTRALARRDHVAAQIESAKRPHNTISGR
ncbi:hypothetical protein ACGYTQ_10290 [Burkholderia pseudomallei]|uniref:hypothetical protein n=1 Tax=Burkholderia pseudomallei TaxID=28450 RepID=UPI0003A86C43|nr:hypothetical protein [Burkholderia pseudomallei]KIX61042.1 hypothetical protein SZ31_11890 [Burkholderia pseudomallei]MBF3451134.1 hypothetical protein [Burkholderia pseudomallei]MBF3475507.1 hypothetical protein [Burkholderia pseudomallei]MBF3511196.1 hypothetical protein [Burkholderia pseudomallei]MBF3513827.1 hypothetical protein [Burkholderia pseudomallei]